MNSVYKFVVTSIAFCLPTASLATDWDVSLWGKPRAFTEHVEKLAELVSAKTDGEFTLNISYGGLSKNRANLENLSLGKFEMAQFCVGYHPMMTPTLTVMELPFLGINSLEAERRVSQAVYDHPVVRQDLARWNATLLMPSPLPQYNLAGVGKAPKNLYSMRKLSVRATGGIATAMKVLEMEPVSMSATDVQDALNDKLISAVAFAPHAHMAFGVAEKAEWWTTNLNPGTVHCPVVVNTDAMAALSADHYEALKSSVDEALDHYVANYKSNAMTQWEDNIRDRDIEQITLNETALAILKDAAHREAIVPWIEEKAKEGIPATELLDLVAKTAAGSSTPTLN